MELYLLAWIWDNPGLLYTAAMSLADLEFWIDL